MSNKKATNILTILTIVGMIAQLVLTIVGMNDLFIGKIWLGVFMVTVNPIFFMVNAYSLIRLNV